MNLALSDEQVFLREAARGALSRFKTFEAARAALDGDDDALPDLWPTVVDAGWPGLLIGEEHGGAGLGAFDALLVAEECGRVLAGVPLLGLLPASAILNAARDESLAAVAAGESRPAYSSRTTRMRSGRGGGRSSQTSQSKPAGTSIFFLDSTRSSGCLLHQTWTRSTGPRTSRSCTHSVRR